MPARVRTAPADSFLAFSADSQQETTVHFEPIPASFRPLYRKANVRCASSVIAISICAILAVGCGQVEEIRRYQAPKSKTTSRMLGAIILHGETAWFFKASGPVDPVAEQSENFRELIKSIRFVESKPLWTLPEGWREKPSSGIRFATLEFGPAKTAIELSITQLAIFGDDRTAYLVDNVNRWRDQLQLPLIGIEELDDHTERIDVEDAVATLVDLVGQPKRGGMGRSHFRAGAGREPGQTEKR